MIRCELGTTALDRVFQVPRRHWQSELEDIGFDFHSIGPDGEPRNDGAFHYWREDVAYRFTEAEVERLYAATRDLHAMALETVDAVVRAQRFAPYHLPPGAAEAVTRSWERQDRSLLGRFDLAFDGGTPKLLEYNADTPTSLLEASVAQWYWKESVQRKADQFNSIHEALVARWRQLRTEFPQLARVHAAAMLESLEDAGNARYVLETAREAGLAGTLLDMREIGVDPEGRFVDLADVPIETCFKLYPWEWALADRFGPSMLVAPTRWIEPAWKMLLSNKALLPLLWERYPDHPNLVPAWFEPTPLAAQPHVRKPLFSREGANVRWVPAEGAAIEAPGTYGAEGYVWQALAPLACYNGMYAVVGSWIVGDEPAGIGMREDSSPITRDTSYFVPHYFT